MSSAQPTIVEQFTVTREVDDLAPVRQSVTPKEAREVEARENGKKRKADPPSKASTSAPRKRKEEKAASASAPVPAPAPARQPDEEILAEYRCPITQELPVDPVVAEDGQCYDRAAIEEWFGKDTVDHSKSPMTNQLIGKKLVPALQMRSAIERLISKGILTGEAAEAWTERQEELKWLDREYREKLAKAYKGERECMRMIGFCYRDGSHGFKQSVAKAAEWFKKAAAKGSPMAIVSMGILYINGNGVHKDVSRGLIELMRAAMLGSEHGAITIGNVYATGEHIERKDEEEATRWYKYSLTCHTRDTIDAFRERRDEWLEKRGLLSG